MVAKVKILVEGFSNADSVGETGEEATCATVSLILDEGISIVVDPGILESQQILVDALKKENLNIEDIDIVCITHSHLDHYRNVGMFPNAKVLEFFGLWHKNSIESWSENFTPNIQILKTPGHDYTGITPFVTTENGVVAICGDIFWKENYPEDPGDDNYASDYEKLAESRELVLDLADWVIPGHAGIYKVNKNKSLEDRLAVAEESENKKVIIVCKNCKRPVQKQRDLCLCRTYLCYRCCKCDLYCDLCNCKQRRFKSWQK
jgi:glyoxylase-like metal-dependent hydrolase (beta-lactamase superfamily II)